MLPRQKALSQVRPKELTVLNSQGQRISLSTQFDIIKGLATHYIDIGQGSPITLIHGAQSWMYTWRNNLYPLSQNFRTLALDLKGFGYSERPRGRYSIRAMADFIEAFLASRKVTKTVLIGSSAGGAFVLDLASSRPDLVSGIVLVSSCGISHDRPLLWDILKVPILGEIMMALNNRWMVRRQLLEIFHDKRLVTEEMVEAIYKPLTLPGSNRASLRETRQHDPRNIDLAKITMPALIVWGDKDPWHPMEMARRFQVFFPQAQFEILENAGHLPHEEKPAEFNQIVTKFVSELSSP